MPGFVILCLLTPAAALAPYGRVQAGRTLPRAPAPVAVEDGEGTGFEVRPDTAALARELGSLPPPATPLEERLALMLRACHERQRLFDEAELKEEEWVHLCA